MDSFATYNAVLFEPDGDSVYYYLDSCSDVGHPSFAYKQIAYAAGRSVKYPMDLAGPLKIDHATGEISFTPITTSWGWVCIYADEFKNGKYIGTTSSDLIIQAYPCANNNPWQSGMDGSLRRDTTICPGQTLCFSVFSGDQNIGDSVRAVWGEEIAGASYNVSSGQYPVANFCWTPAQQDTGFHYVTLQVLDDACAANGRRREGYQIRVRQPEFDIVQDTAVCRSGGWMPQFTEPGTYHTWQWSPSVGLSDPSIAHPTITPGSLPMTYTVTGSNGLCSFSDTMRLTQLRLRGAITSSSDTLICLDEVAILRTQPPGATYVWTTGDTGHVVLADTAGIYGVDYEDQQGCLRYDSLQLYQVQLQAPTADAGPDSLVICPGQPAVLGGSPTAIGGTAPYQYTWSPPGNLNNANHSNPTITGSGVGDYIVIVEDANGCMNVDLIYVSAGGIEADAGTDTLICPGGMAILGGMPVAIGGLPPYSYAWTPQASLNQSIAAHPEARPLSPTFYALEVTDGNGCVAYDTVEVDVRPPILADAGATQHICAGDSAHLGGSPTAGGGTPPFQYLWSHGSIQANPPVAPWQTTDYALTITDLAGCEALDTTTVMVLDTPIADFSHVSSGLQVNFQNNSQGAASWHWAFGDQNSSTQQHPSHTYFFAGSYYVCLQVWDADGDCQDLRCDTVEVQTSGLRPLQQFGGLFPNPASSLVYVPAVFIGADVTLTDALGRICGTFDEVTTAFSVAHLPSGIYRAHLQLDEQVHVVQLAISR